MKHGIIYKNEKNFKFNFFAWGTVARLGDGRLAYACSGFRFRHACPFGKVVMLYSDDDGKTWSAPEIILDTPLDDRDAGLTVNGNDVFVTTFHNTSEKQRIFLTAPYTGYKTETERNEFVMRYLDLITAKEEEDNICSNILVSHDNAKTFQRYDMPMSLNTTHGISKFRNGGYFLIGRITGKEVTSEEYFLKSEDGIHWSKPVTLLEGYPNGLLYNEVNSLETREGIIIAHHRVENGVDVFTVYQSESFDKGETFTEPKPLGFDGAPPHLIEHSSGALICAYGKRSEPYGIKAAVSFDGGRTWPYEIVLRDDGAGSDLGYPTSVELEDGKILTAYYFTSSELMPYGRSLEYTVWDLSELKERNKDEIKKMF